MDWPNEETKNLILTSLLNNKETYKDELVTETILLAEKMNLYQSVNGRTSPAPLAYVDSKDQMFILNKMDEVLEELKANNYLEDDTNDNLILLEDGEKYINSVLPQNYLNML